MRQQPTDVGVHVFFGGLWNLHSVNAPLLLRDWGPSEKKYESTGIRLVVDADDECVYRGSSWDNTADDARAANRGRSNPGFRNLYLGFRLTGDNSPENTLTTKEMA